MIKILFFLPSLTGGGAERTIVNIANGLDRNTYEVHFLVIDKPDAGKYKDEYFYLLKKDIIIHNLNIQICKKNYIKILFGMRKIIRKIAPDIAMSTMLRPNIMLAGALIISGYNGKVVLRESTHRTENNTNIIERLLIKFFYGKYADKTVALSFGVKKDLCKKFNVNKSKISVIYNPVDIESINILKNESVLLKNENVIVTVGRLIPEKNYFGLIDALAILHRKHDFTMYILGKGELEEQIKSKIKSVGLENHIILEGFQDNPYKYLTNADIFVLNSNWEGFGHVIVEAMACGVAVVSTNCPYGPREIITDHINGLLVPVRNPKKMATALEELLKNYELRKCLKENGLKRALDFSSEKIVKQYEKLFDDILGKTL